MTMHKLNIWKGSEVLIEDEESGDVELCFYDLGARDIYVSVDDERLFDLDNVPFSGDNEVATIPEGYRAHEIVWRTIEFDINLNDANHELTQDDFTYRVVEIRGNNFHALELKEDVGELEFIYSSDGIMDQEIEVD